MQLAVGVLIAGIERVMHSGVCGIELVRRKGRLLVLGKVAVVMGRRLLIAVVMMS